MPDKRKKGNGEGSVRFNQKTKKWEARCTYGFRPDGTAERRSRSANSEPEAKRILNEGRLVDYTRGRKTRALIYLDNGTAVASVSLPETLAKRFDKPGK